MPRVLDASPSPPVQKLLTHAKYQTQVTKRYDPSYVKLTYPNGDVPLDRGVCTDVLIRAFREAGVDLQVRVHQDMRKNFSKYPKKWGLKSTDRNIDHRRVPNLMTFFRRQGKKLKLSKNPQDYQAGDIVAWLLPSGLYHIGIVSDGKTADGKRNLVIHNIGAGTQEEDILFEYKILGHYRYF